jgi:hypothetical protein
MLGKLITIGLAIFTVSVIAGCGSGFEIVLDNTDPSMSISGIVDGQDFHDFPFPSANPHITGVAADDSGIASFTLEIDGVLVESNNGPNLNYTWDWDALPYGPHELKFEATDNNSNTYQVIYNVTTSFI